MVEDWQALHAASGPHSHAGGKHMQPLGAWQKACQSGWAPVAALSSAQATASVRLCMVVSSCSAGCIIADRSVWAVQAAYETLEQQDGGTCSFGQVQLCSMQGRSAGSYNPVKATIQLPGSAAASHQG